MDPAGPMTGTQVMTRTTRVDPFDLVGTTLASKYQVECLVEETALSVVYRALHTVWRRPVAIKAFKASAQGEARGQLLDAFVREGALLTELSERCAAICQARDVASTTTARGEWVPYMVLEWLDGEPLELLLGRERARGGRRRSVIEAMRLLEPVGTALAVAHERGIVHCDVKPGNIFVLNDAPADNLCCKLLDFGIAKVLRRASGSDGAPFGHSFTPAYGAPEQFSAAHGKTGPWTDVYALALVLVELLAGREALRGASVDELGARSCDPEKRPTPRTLGVRVSDEEERIFARALAMDPADRFANVGAFWRALRAAVSRVAIEKSMPILLVRPRRARRRILPALALAAGAAVVVAQHWVVLQHWTAVLRGMAMFP
jgi:serine/threonine protein kinase